MKKHEIERLTVNVTSFMFGGLIFISLIILQNFISSEAHDITVLISLSCLSLALPVLAGGLVVNYVGKELAPEGKTPTWATVLIWLAMSIDIIGITAAIWHASWISAILFQATTMISSGIYYSSCRAMLQKAYAKTTETRDL